MITVSPYPTRKPLNRPLTFRGFDTASLEKREVLNRVVMDVFGWGGPGIVFARNFYERVEKSLDIGSWLVAGVLFPWLLDKLVNKHYTNHLRKKTPEVFLSNTASPLGMPFEWFRKTRLLPQSAKTLEKYGMREVPQALARSILRGKVFYILLADMLLMASKGQGYFWGKNFLTEWLSGKKGFSGEFSYAKNEYLKQKAAAYEKNKKKRMLASLVIGYGSAVALPVLIWGILRSGKTGKLTNFLRNKIIPHFNYQDTIYMSKWVLTWHTFFNWNIPSILSSRDSHEFRENAVKTSVLLTIYTIGDDLINGALARFLDKFARKRWNTPLLAEQKGLFRMPKLMSVEKMIEKYGKGSAAHKLGVANFWVGILGVCLAINSILPVLNNYYTKKKVLREQEELEQQERKRRLLHPTALPQTPYAVLPKQPTSSIAFTPLQPAFQVPSVSPHWASVPFRTQPFI